MENKIAKMKENYLTKKPRTNALNSTLVLVLMLFYGSYIYLNGLLHADQWMPASAQSVFGKGEYWRAWTTLFAHGDLGHISSNLILFFPFAYFLTGYFGYFFFPVFGFFVGGLINLLVLKTMPDHVWLIGVSGVVYWMGATWITLSFLIDRRESIGKSLVKVIGISAILFVPDTFQANISYMTHFGGYFFGMLSGVLFYLIFRKKIRGADVFEEIIDNEFDSEIEYENSFEDKQEPIVVESFKEIL